MKEEFINIFREKIKRDGCDKLLNWLESSDFFTAPASGKFHLSEKGGLCRHSVNVYKRLVCLAKAEFGEDLNKFYPAEKYDFEETLAVCGLLHDVCKVNFYKEDFRNQKDENGNWIKVPFYKVEEKLPFGHGEKSVFLINNFIKLNVDEAVAINWHMGGFDLRVLGGSQSVSEAYDKYPLALLLHLADMQATYLDENSKFQEKKLKETK